MTQPVSAAATVAVRHISAYLDLLQSDLDIGIGLARSRLIAACVMGAALLMAVALVCGWIVAEAWNTPQRPWVVGGLLTTLGRDCLRRLLETARPAVRAQAVVTDDAGAVQGPNVC